MTEEEEFRIYREGIIRNTLDKFFRDTAINIITDDGISLSIDLAFKIDRKKLVGEAMMRIGKELLENEDFL